MYDLSKIQEPEKLSKQSILDKITEEDIMRHYLGFDFQVGRPYSSPFREDKNPSFALYYTKDRGLRFKDFNGLQGTCFDLVMNLYGATFVETLNIINTDLGLNIGKVKATGATRKIISSYKPEVIERKRLIQIKPQHWTKVDAKYWKQFGITSKILKRFNVYSAKFVFLDKQLILQYMDYSPIYAYKFNGRTKIYRPLADKTQFKWMSNVQHEDLQGLEQLEYKSDTLIITKSLKDVMCLYMLGYEAVAPQSENTRTQFDLLKELIPKYEKIIILYDNDEAGMLGAKTLEEFLNEDKVKSVFIKDPNTKDISDYIETYGVNCGQLLIKMLIDE